VLPSAGCSRPELVGIETCLLALVISDRAEKSTPAPM